jgi:hypothetical protein
MAKMTALKTYEAAQKRRAKLRHYSRIDTSSLKGSMRCTLSSRHWGGEKKHLPHITIR